MDEVRNVPKKMTLEDKVRWREWEKNGEVTHHYFDGIDVKSIEAQARKELAEEEFKAAVAKYKEKMKQKKTLWERVFPFKIIVIRREKLCR